jgi:hypothetical protein
MGKRHVTHGTRGFGSRVHAHLRANAVAYLALFVALGGTSAWAADKITSGQIAKNAVLSKHIKRGQVKRADIGPRAVTSSKVADGSLATADLADGAINGAKLAAGAATTAKIADSAINSAKVANNGLSAVDISTVTGSVDHDYPSIAANSCLVAVVDAGVDIENDVIAVSASDAFTDQGFTLYAADSNTPNAFRIIACNVTGAAIDPPNANLRFIIFRR